MAKNVGSGWIHLDARWTYVLDFEGDELTEAWSARAQSRRARGAGFPLHPLLADTYGAWSR